VSKKPQDQAPAPSSPNPPSSPDEPAPTAPPSPSPERVIAYMVRLAGDPSALTEFMRGPSQAMQDAGLAQDEQDALNSGDQNRIYAMLKGLPPPPPAPPPPPVQLPTVVAAMQLQGTGGGASPGQTAPGQAQPAPAPTQAVQPQAAAQPPAYWVVGAQQPGQVAASPQAGQGYGALPYPFYVVAAPQQQPQPTYYIVPWPTWPTR
jgi:hypothetical protein